MRKAMLIIGIMVIVVGALALLWGGLSGYIGKHTLDAPFSFYEKHRKNMKIYLSLGTILTVAGILCLLFSKLKGH